MRCVIIVKATKESEAGAMTSQQVLVRWAASTRHSSKPV